MINYEYNILWVDDIWSESIKDSQDMKIQRMKEVASSIMKLGQDFFELKITYKESVPLGYTELSDNVKADYRLLILDFDFGENAYGYNLETLIKPARAKKIPYIIYTNLSRNATIQTALYENDPLNLGIIQKDVEGGKKIVNIIDNFFQNLPFRILQISDLHCNSASNSDKAKKSQQMMFESLYVKLEEISKTTPIDLLFFTGDFAAHDPRRELIDVNLILRKIITSSFTHKEPMSNVFIIPGNHDLLWDDFRDKTLSHAPWSSFINLYQTLFNEKIELLKNTKGWDSVTKTINHYVDSDGLFWNRKFPQLKLNIIGISSTSTEPEMQGKGIFTDKVKQYINECWENAQSDEIKIALVHHNLFTVVTPNPNDEDNIVKNSGLAIHTLIRNKCNLIFSGHTHFGTFVKFSVANQNMNGFSDLSDISCISNGTVGGITPNYDRARSFNIIDINHKNNFSKKREMTIKPFYYDSTENKWIDRNSIITEI